MAHLKGATLDLEMDGRDLKVYIQPGENMATMQVYEGGKLVLNSLALNPLSYTESIANTIRDGLAPPKAQ